MFCSAKCYVESYKKVSGKDELIKETMGGDETRQKSLRIMYESLFIAGNIAELQKIYFQNQKTVFDFKLIDPTDGDFKKRLLICENSLQQKTDSAVATNVANYLSVKQPDGPDNAFLTKFISRIILNTMRNGINFPSRDGNQSDGEVVMLFVSLLNHSCDPNVHVSFAENKCVVTVLKPIAAGDQIFINYRWDSI